MSAKKTTLTVLFLWVLFFNSTAQNNSVKLLIEVPLQFGAGYEGKISKRLSVAFSAGILTQPNSALIVDVLEAFGTDEQITLMISDAFTFGLVGKAGLNYNVGKNYFGAFLEVIDLHAGNTPKSLVESYYGTNVNNYPARRNRTLGNETFLKLTSTLYQGGLLYGRRFPLKNEHFEIDTELALSANLYSHSKLTSEYRDLSTLSTEVDKELSGYYSGYAFVPSLAIALVYKFSR